MFQTASLMGSLRTGIRILSGEFFATMLLVFLGCGSVVAAAKLGTSDSPVVQIALGWGMAYMTVIFTFSRVSGAVVNPALVLALYVARKLPLGQAILYLIVEGLKHRRIWLFDWAHTAQWSGPSSALPFSKLLPPLKLRISERLLLPAGFVLSFALISMINLDRTRKEMPLAWRS